MADKLFDFIGEFPRWQEGITIYSTQKSKEQKEQELKRRREKLSAIFGITGQMVNKGDRFAIAQNSKMLELYAASDSFWYQDDKHFASENKKQGQNIPEKRAAFQIADTFLKRNTLVEGTTVLNSITYTSVAKKGKSTSTIDEYNTEVHVNIGHVLNGIPIFGPGAKTRVSIVNSELISGAYHFYRKQEALPNRRELLKPDLAFEIFNKNFRFAQLTKSNARANVKSMQLGYYALPPSKQQNYLVPVYKLKGSISTAALPSYDFEHYVIAVKYTDEDVKSMGMNIGGVKALVF